MSKVLYDLAKTQLRYDPKSGHFYWKVKTNNKNEVGQIAGSVHKKLGYVFTSVKGHRFLAHRLAFYFIHGRIPRMVDHINRDRSDNRIANLREITDHESNINKRPHRKAKSGFRGVYLRKGRKKPYKTQGRLLDGTIKYIGDFHTADEAQAAYLAFYKAQGIEIDLNLDI